MECGICGMSYIPENPSDVCEHKIYHDEIVNGIIAIEADKENTVWHNDNLKITVVSNLSDKQLKDQAEEVGRKARKDTPYGAEVLFGELDINVFLLHKENRIIGYLPIDKRDQVWRVSWKEYDSGNIHRVADEKRQIWCICMIWILSKWRRCKYAKLLFERAIQYLNADLDNIAWYVPKITSEGKAFMQCYCPEYFNIAR